MAGWNELDPVDCANAVSEHGCATLFILEGESIEGEHLFG